MQLAISISCFHILSWSIKFSMLNFSALDYYFACYEVDQNVEFVFYAFSLCYKYFSANNRNSTAVNQAGYEIGICVSHHKENVLDFMFYSSKEKRQY